MQPGVGLVDEVRIRRLAEQAIGRDRAVADEADDEERGVNAVAEEAGQRARCYHPRALRSTSCRGLTRPSRWSPWPARPLMVARSRLGDRRGRRRRAGPGGGGGRRRLVRRHHAGDLIVFAPAWVDPVGRLHLGDLIPIEMAARMDADRYGTIWELSIRGARAPETRGLGRPAWSGLGGGVRCACSSRRRPQVHRLRQRVREAARGARPAGRASSWPRSGSRRTAACRRCRSRAGPYDVARRRARPGELVGVRRLADVFTRRDVREPGELAVSIGGKQARRWSASTTAGAPAPPARGCRRDGGDSVVSAKCSPTGCFAAEATSEQHQQHGH